jgi:N,N'-diacetyllegionaminate synthase
MQHTLIIAEIGECYNGDMATAYKLIETAKSCGCDMVKFQTLDVKTIDDDDPERDWFYKIAMTPERIRLLKAYADKTGIGILFTPQDAETAGWLLECGLTSVKLASNAIGNRPLIQFCGEHFKTVFVSTGMATLDEVAETVDLLKNAEQLIIFHCVSEYPTGPLLEKNGLTALKSKNVHLNMMLILKMLFPEHRIGYSDHTLSAFIPALAVAMGAEAIEKHITLDRKTPFEHYTKGLEYMGTDHMLSLEPDELAEMVMRIREAETVKGDWKWKRSEGEIILREFIRERFR